MKTWFSLIKISDWDSFRSSKKRIILNFSLSTAESDFGIVNLSSIDWYIIETKRDMLPYSLINQYEIFSLKKIEEIKISGVYTGEIFEDIDPKDSEGKTIIRTSNVDDDEFLRVRHKGIMNSQILAGQEKDIDWQMEQLTYAGKDKPSIMVGVEFKAVGGNDGDYLDFSVVDIDDVLGQGAGTVVDQFAENIYVFPDHVSIFKEHRADLIAGLYVRAHYNNTGANDVTFICNLLRYVDTE